MSLTFLICLMYVTRSQCKSASFVHEELKRADDAACCPDSNCASYRGNLAKSSTGKDCIPWANLFRSDRWTAAKNPNSGLESNYCRNPSSHTNTWCYVEERKRGQPTVWENCDMRPCVPKDDIDESGETPDDDGERIASVCTSWKEKREMTLNCPAGKNIEILKAFYGYWSGPVEKCHAQGGDCQTDTDIPSCSGNSCVVTAEESSISLDCFKIHDYLQVEFKCA